MKVTDREDYDAGQSPAFDYSEEENESEQQEESEPEAGKRRGGMKLLTSIQVFGSLAILAAALILRFSQADPYQKVRAWYLSAVNDSILADEQIDQAKHTVVGLWNDISAAGLRSTSAQSEAESQRGQVGSQQQPASSAKAADSSGKAAS